MLEKYFTENTVRMKIKEIGVFSSAFSGVTSKIVFWLSVAVLQTTSSLWGTSIV